MAARSFLAQAGLFAAGTGLAVVHVRLARGQVRLPRGWRPPTAVLVLAAVPLLLDSDRRWAPDHLLMLGLSGSCALLLALVVLPHDVRPRLVSVLETRPLHWAGLVSYGVFLWNEPLVWALQRGGLTSDGAGGFALALLTTSVVTGAVATLSWLLVEKPASSLRSGRTGGRPPAGLTVQSARDPGGGL